LSDEGSTGDDRAERGRHLAVLCEETVNLVVPERDDEAEESARARTYVDATFGRGGHTRALLARLGQEGRVIGIDRDLAAVEAGEALAVSEPRFTIHHARFTEIERVLDAQGVDRVDGVIMDLGVSSPQLDNPSRGFSFRGAGPIDMRMDQSHGQPAAEWLNRADAGEIASVLREFGEERYARRIAAAIVRRRPFENTRELADVVRGAIPGRGIGRADTATRTFQAIRIHVNEELTEVEGGIRAAFERLAIGARLAVISFHSLEDKLVKKSFRELSRGPQLPRRLPVRDTDPRAKVIAGPVRASAKELAVNPRSRSATLRVLERLE
jgi:16S rRNA (cytosine1402-N4)-methyltransferase